MKTKLFEMHAAMCRTFTSPKRLEILNQLRDREISVGQMAKYLDIKQANLSQHLSILREKGIVKTRRSGVTIKLTTRSASFIGIMILQHPWPPNGYSAKAGTMFRMGPRRRV